jgi:hypothetical protein
MGSSKSKIAKVDSSLKIDKKNENNVVEIVDNKVAEIVENKVVEIVENKEVVESNVKKNSHISEEKLDEFIDEILKDQNINIDYFPDVVERKIYRNVLILMFSLLNKSIDTASVQFIGHEIKFVMSPMK